MIAKWDIQGKILTGGVGAAGGNESPAGISHRKKFPIDVKTKVVGLPLLCVSVGVANELRLTRSSRIPATQHLLHSWVVKEFE
jgi:hypothetical protein